MAEVVLLGHACISPHFLAQYTRFTWQERLRSGSGGGGRSVHEKRHGIECEVLCHWVNFSTVQYSAQVEALSYTKKNRALIIEP